MSGSRRGPASTSVTSSERRRRSPRRISPRPSMPSRPPPTITTWGRSCTVAAPSQPGDFPADSGAIVDALEGQCVLLGAAHAERVVHAADSHDARVELDALAGGQQCAAPPRVDAHHLGRHEAVAGALHQPRARQAQVGSTLHAGQQLVDVGQPLEPRGAVDDRHVVPAVEVLRRRDPGEIGAHDQDAGFHAWLHQSGCPFRKVAGCLIRPAVSLDVLATGMYLVVARYYRSKTSWSWKQSSPPSARDCSSTWC